MSEETPPKRRILSLKQPVVLPKPPGWKPPPPALWKCKPCGSRLEVAHDAAGVIRCPSCNARLGKAEDFLSDPPKATLRARKVVAASP